MANRYGIHAPELDVDDEELFGEKPRCKKMYPNCPWSNYYTSKAFGTDVSEDYEQFESHIEDGCAGFTSARQHKFVFNAEQRKHIGLAQKVTCNVVGKKEEDGGKQHEKHFSAFQDYAGVKSGGDNARRKGTGSGIASGASTGEQKKTALIRPDAVSAVMGSKQQVERYNYEEWMDDWGDGAAGVRTQKAVEGNDQVQQITDVARRGCGIPNAPSTVGKTLHNRASIAPTMNSRNKWLSQNFQGAAGIPAGGEKRYHSKPGMQCSSMVSHVVFNDEPPDYDNDANLFDDSFGARSGAVLSKSMPHLYTTNPTPNQFSNPLRHQRQSVAMAMNMTDPNETRKPQSRNKAMLPW